ncbi:hypothetical protein [Caldiplasma sukawensis]
MYAEKFWREKIDETVRRGKIEFKKDDKVPDPSDSGLFRRSVGEIKGQKSDWRHSLQGRREGIHLIEFNDRYEMHVDRYDPSKNPLGHLIFDSPIYGLIAFTATMFSLILFSGIIKRK